MNAVRRAALDALTAEDLEAISLALIIDIRRLEQALLEGRDLAYWQKRLDGAKVAYERVFKIEFAS
jgi:hypothetical protein